jgi:tetratricopeptide (TPR) repeat protein
MSMAFETDAMPGASHKSFSATVELLGIIEEFPELKSRTEKEPHLDIAKLLQEYFKGAGESIVVTVNGRQSHIEWKIPSGSPEAEQLNIQAFTQARNREMQKAIDMWIEAKYIHPADPDYLFNIALAYIELQDFGKAIDFCLETIRVCPIYHRAYLTLGSLYSKVKKYSEAETSLRKGIRFQKDNIVALINLGAVQSLMEKYDEAIQAFERVIALSSKESRAYLGLAKIYYLRRDFENASRCFKAVLKIDQNSKSADIATKYLESITSQLSPAQPNPPIPVKQPAVLTDNPEEIYAKAFQNFIDGDYDSAILYYTGYLKLNPSDPDAWAALASCQLRKGNLQSAIESIQRAIALNPKGTYFKQAAIIYDSCGMTDESGQAAKRAFDMGKNDSITFMLLGKSYMEGEQSQEAVKFLQEAVKLNPANLNARYELAKVLKKSGQREASRHELEEILWSKNSSPLKELAEKEIKTLV